MIKVKPFLDAPDSGVHEYVCHAILLLVEFI